MSSGDILDKSMKKLFLGSLAIALVLGGIVWYQLRDTSDTGTVVEVPAEETDSEVHVPEAVPMAGTESFRTLIAKPGNLECAITTEGGTTDTMTGTYFASNGLIRADVLVAGAVSGTPESTVTSMVVTPDTLYTWAIIEGEGYGVKSVFPDQTLSTAKPEPGKQTPIDFDGQVTYDCKPWEVVDTSIFEPPSTIIFKDFSATIGAGMEDGTIYPEGQTGPALTPEDMHSGDPCALCDKVALGEGQDQCRANFKC